MNISAIDRRWGVNRGLLNVWRREAGLTSRRSEQACAQQAMFLPVTVVGDRTSSESLPSDVAHCCSVDLHCIGEDISEALDIVPAVVRVKWTIRLRYACRACESVVVQAPAPARVMDGGMVTRRLQPMSPFRSSPGICRCIARRRCLPPAA